MNDPISGGCCDGLEKDNVNLNQGAESTVCYLIARLTVDNYQLTGKIKTKFPSMKVKKNFHLDDK
jgi:hypothetical protein